MVKVQDLYTFINGEYVTDKDAVIPIHDGGFTRGDAVFDTCRTFRGEIYKLEEHIDRLFMSLKYMQIESPYNKKELMEFTNKLLELNNHLLTEKDDYWVFLRITRGSKRTSDGPVIPNVIIHCVPLPLAERCEYYKSGIPLIISSIRRTSHEALSPRAKVNQYIKELIKYILSDFLKVDIKELDKYKIVSARTKWPPAKLKIFIEKCGPEELRRILS